MFGKKKYSIRKVDSVSSCRVSIMNEVCTVIEFLFYFIFLKILYSLILGCIPGYSGINCTSLCPYPQYGVDCQRECNCSKDMCDVSTGCQQITTGNMNI